MFLVGRHAGITFFFLLMKCTFFFNHVREYEWGSCSHNVFFFEIATYPCIIVQLLPASFMTLSHSISRRLALQKKKKNSKALIRLDFENTGKKSTLLINCHLTRLCWERWAIAFSLRIDILHHTHRKDIIYIKTNEENIQQHVHLNADFKFKSRCWRAAWGPRFARPL